MEHLTIVPADGHIVMPYSGSRDYIDPGYRPTAATAIEFDERLVQHFHGRSGYRGDVEAVDITKIDERCLPDLQRLST